MHKYTIMKKESMVLSLFLLLLVLCLSLKIGLEIALFFGAILFSFYAVSDGYSLREVVRMLCRGAWKARTVAFLMLVIGMLTAMWRASGTIAVIVTALSTCFRPSVFYLMVFWSNALVSFLIGTSFGTSATMGVVCMTIARTMGMSPWITGGAILSGIFVGDRCSPLSTSAMLIADITGTKLFDNLRHMMRDTVIPFGITSFIFFLLSMLSHQDRPLRLSIAEVFSKEFILSPICFIPAVLILIFAFFKVNIKITMFLSIVAAMGISILVQRQSIPGLLQALFYGFRAHDTDVAGMLNGGGMRSMISVCIIVLVSSSYSGIFENTKILVPIQNRMEMLERRIGIFGTTVVCSVVSTMLACNQTFAAILVQQIIGKMHTDKTEQMLNLEDSVILISGLIPWCIAGSVPLATVEAPLTSMALGIYLYMVPLVRLIRKKEK